MYPIRLKVYNFLSHEKSEIDFSKFNVAMVLGATYGNLDQSNGSGKCLGANTILTDAISGKRMTVKQLHENKEPFYVFGFNDEYKLSPVKVNDSIYSGRKKLLKVTTSNGRSEIVSEEHPIYTSGMCTEIAKNLNVGDFVAQPRILPLNYKNKNSKMGQAKARILALYMAEGGLTSGIRFTNTNKEIIDIAKLDLYNEFYLATTKNKITYSIKRAINIKNVRRDIINRLNNINYNLNSLFGKNLSRALKLESGAKIEKLIKINDPIINKLILKQNPRKTLAKFLNDNGILGKKSNDKRINNNIFTSSEGDIKAFIGMFWSCDGFISDISNGKKRIEVSVGLSSEGLIDDIQSLLLTFGILSTKRYKRIKNKYESWVLTLNTNFDNINIFFNLFGEHLIGPKKEKLLNMIQFISKNSNTNIDVIPSNIYIDRITNVKNFISKEDGLNLSRNQLKNHNLSRYKLGLYAEKLQIGELKKISKSDIIWRKIIKIEELGEHDTYDIQIDSSNHLYALDGFITHNSAIFEAILWALYGKSRHKKKDGVVKRNAKKATVEFIFSVDSTLYKITRRRDKTIGESEVILKQWDGNQYVSISCDTNTATDKKIVKIINVNYDVFINSVYFKQNDISMFAEATPSKRKDILKALLKMDIWDSYKKKANAHKNRLAAKVEEKSINIVSLAKIDEDLKTYRDNLSVLCDNVKKSDEKYKDLNDNLITYKSEYNAIHNDISSNPDVLKRLQKEYIGARRRLTAINKTINANNKSITSSSSEVNGLQQKIQSLNECIDGKKGINLQSIRSYLLKGKTKERILKEHLSELEKEIKTGKMCYTCRRPITKAEVKAMLSNRKNDYDNMSKEYKEVRSKLTKAERAAKEKEKLVQLANKSELDKGKTDIKISKHKNIINGCIDESKRLEKEKSTILSRNFKDEIDSLKIKFDKDRVEDLNQNIIKLEDLAAASKRRYDKLNVEYGSKNRIYNELIEKKKEQTDLQKEIEKLNSEISVYDKLRHYFGKDGIQSIIIENVIEELENYSNDILSKICNEPTSISIKTQRHNDSGSWSETFDIEVNSESRKDDFETFSGGEQFRISLALRLALSKILSSRMGGNVKFLLLDEVSSSLDDKGLNMFMDIIKQLGNELKILVISHDDILKEKFDDIIMVNKTSTGSHISLQ